MSRAKDSTALQSLFESGRQVPRQPDTVRARAVARARTTAASPPLAASSLETPPPRFLTRLLAPTAAVAIVAAGAGYVMSVRSQPSTQPREVVAAPSATLVAPVAPAPAPVVTDAPKTSATPAGVSSGRRSNKSRESFDAEFELLRSAHTAYASHDYASALVLVAEHARRFPHGALAEEREALRVRCLVASGRGSEARRVASSFSTRFPRSVLLSQMQELVRDPND